MANKNFGYWSGMATGMVLGVIAAAYLPRLFGEQPSEESGQRTAFDVLRAVSDAPEETKGHAFASRRDAPESAGDPSIVAGAAGRSGVEFRRAGAPGPRAEAEQLTVPGQHGQKLDPSRPVIVSSRTLNLESKTP